jgi:hypothetical protein
MVLLVMLAGVPGWRSWLAFEVFWVGENVVIIGHA